MPFLQRGQYHRILRLSTLHTSLKEESETKGSQCLYCGDSRMWGLHGSLPLVGHSQLIPSINILVASKCCQLSPWHSCDQLSTLSKVESPEIQNDCFAFKILFCKYFYFSELILKKQNFSWLIWSISFSILSFTSVLFLFLRSCEFDGSAFDFLCISHSTGWLFNTSPNALSTWCNLSFSSKRSLM